MNGDFNIGFEDFIQKKDVDYLGFIVDKKNGKIITISEEESKKFYETTSSAKEYDLTKVTQSYKTLRTENSNLHNDMQTSDVVLSCAQTLLEKNTFEVSITKLLGILCDYFGGEFACLFERDYETSTTHVRYKYHKNNDKLIDKKYTQSFKISKEDEWTRYLRENDYALLRTSDDIDPKLSGSSYYDRFMQSSRNNLLVVSLNDNDTILGGIEIDNITQNIENIHIIKTVSAFIVNNLHIKNSHMQLQKNLVELENENDINLTMLECVKTLVDDADSIQDSMNKLLENVTNYYNADATNIFYNALGKDSFKCSYSYSKEVTDLELVPEIPANDVINLFNNFDIGGVGYISSIREMSHILESTFLESHQALLASKISSLLFVPLKSNGKIVGFMGVENPKRHLKEIYLIKATSNFVINHINKNELLIKLKKLSYSDSLTGLYNRNFYNSYLDEFKVNPRNSVGIIFGDVNGLKKVNDNFGHELGDKLIKWSAKFFDESINGLNFRIGGDEFVGIIENIPQDDFNSLVDEIINKCNQFGDVHISIGRGWANNFPNVEEIIVNADSDMYTQKKAYYKHLSNDERSIKDSLQDFKNSIQKLNV